MTFEGLNPANLRAFATTADGFVTTVSGAAGTIRDLIAQCELSSGAPGICDEIVDEVGLLAQLGRAKATDMEYAAAGIYLPSAAAGLLDRLQLSLDDNIGDNGMTGDNALASMVAGFSIIDADGDGYLSFDELQAAADDSSIRPEFAAAAQYLVDNPALMQSAMSISEIDSWMNGDGSVPVASITAEGLTALVAQNATLRLLSDRAVFDEIESAKDGEHDGVLSAADLRSILESDSASDEARAVAEHLLGDATALRWFGYGPNAGNLNNFGTHYTGDDKFDFDDVIAMTVNQQAFAADPGGAHEFVINSLAPLATWTEVSGKMGGIDIQLVADDGLRALASAALADSPTLTDQVITVASLPESGGGVRNQLITFYYAELAGRMNDRLNLGLDPDDVLDPSSAGHTGANWMQFAPWASNSVGPVITGEISADIPLFFDQNPSDSDRQYAADGNQYIFGDVAIRYALFLDAFPADEQPTTASIQHFFDQRHPVTQQKNLFSTGHEQLQESFAYYLGAMEETDPLQRQRLTMMGNILIATHEQAGAQHALAGIVDQDIGDDGLFRGTAGEIGGWFFSGSDEKLATEQMRLGIGLDPDDALPVSEDVPVTTAPRGNLVLGDDLTTTLNPDGRRGVDVGGSYVAFDGRSGDVTLDDISGWSNPPDGSSIDAFPTDTAEWEAEGGKDPADVRQRSRNPNVVPEVPTVTYGTGADNWGAPNERQWYISNLFQQMHADPQLFDGLDDLTLDSDWGRPLDYLPDTVAEVTAR